MWFHHFMAYRWGNSGRLFSWTPKSLQMVTAAMKLRHLLLGRKAMTNLDSILKSRDSTLPTNVHLVSHVWMWELDYRESWALENWCFWTVVLEKTLESSLDCKEIQPVNPKGNRFWIVIGRTMLKLKLQYFGHLMWRTDSLEKTLMLGKIEGRRRRGGQRMGWLDGIIDSMYMSLSNVQKIVKNRKAWHAAVFSSVQSLSHVRLFARLLSFTISLSLLQLMSLS